MWQTIEKLIRRSQERIKGLPLEDEGESPERRNYYRFLYWLIREFEPMVSLEIGVESGLASRYMCEAAKEYGGKVIGVDVRQPGTKLDMPNYTFLLGNSIRMQQALTNLTRAYGPIGLVFQDSSHHYTESHREWQIVKPLMAPNGIWICDDITPAFFDPLRDPPGKGMVQYFDELPGEKRLYENVLHFGNIQGIII